MISVKTRLAVMMFLEYFIWGAWYVTMGMYLGTSLGFTGTEIGLAYGATSLAAMISPFFVGLIADRFFATERILAVLHLAGAGALWLVSSLGSFGTFYPVLVGYTLCYMPTAALTNSLSFYHLADPTREFPRVRVWGTIGWIAAGLIVGQLRLEATATPLRIAALASVVMSLYSLALPHTPPKQLGQRVSLGSILGFDALGLLRERSFAIFVFGSFLMCIPLSFYYAFTNIFLNELGVSEPASKMTLGQFSEIAFMAVMPWFLLRLGIKRTLVIGMAAWAARYVLFAYGDQASLAWMLYAGILLHGVCYDFFFVTGQIYVDQQANERIRASAQGLLAFITLGLGMFIGTWASGRIVETYGLIDAAGRVSHQWDRIWMVPALASAAILVVFALSFRPVVKRAAVAPSAAPARASS